MFAVIFFWSLPPFSSSLQIWGGAAVSVCRRIRDLWGQAVCVFGRRGQVRSMPHMNVLANAYILYNETEWSVLRFVY